MKESPLEQTSKSLCVGWCLQMHTQKHTQHLEEVHDIQYMHYYVQLT